MIIMGATMTTSVYKHPEIIDIINFDELEVKFR